MRYQNIFHIDDDEDDAEIFLSAALEASNAVTIEGFYDARKALDKLVGLQILPDAIFLDLNMPIMDGFEFLRELRSSTAFQNIPVIILSTSSHQDTIDATKKLGADGFITKPSDYNQLVTILRSYLMQ